MYSDGLIRIGKFFKFTVSIYFIMESPFFGNITNNDSSICRQRLFNGRL